MRTIKLHGHMDGQEIRINPEAIALFAAGPGDGTRVYLAGEGNGWEVRESMDEIESLIAAVDGVSGSSSLLSRFPNSEQIKRMLSMNSQERNALLHLEKVVESLEGLAEGEE